MHVFLLLLIADVFEIEGIALSAVQSFLETALVLSDGLDGALVVSDHILVLILEDVELHF